MLEPRFDFFSWSKYFAVSLFLNDAHLINGAHFIKMHTAFLAVALINIHFKRFLGWAGILLDGRQRNDRQLLAIVLHNIAPVGYEGDLELALVPESFRTDILKETMDSNSVLIEDATVETEKFALLFEFDGDVKKIRHVLYNCIASRPTIESSTKEDEIEVKTETLSITASPLSGGYVKARTSDTTTEEAYEGWYQAVYLPTDALGGSAVTADGGNA